MGAHFADSPMRTLVLADGASTTGEALARAGPGWCDDVRLVAAADGGARLAGPLGVTVDRWVGDGDSVDPATLEDLRAAGVAITLVARDKDASDTELAILDALAAGATDVTVVGALGGPRLDHALANIGLLSLAALDDVPARLIDPAARVSLIRAPDARGRPVRAELIGRAGDIVSLLAAGATVEGVTTEDLRYPLRDEPLPAGPARGLSNVRLGQRAAVTVRRGRLLVVESPATLSP
jgi:thiamine pyrophosphokinase